MYEGCLLCPLYPLLIIPIPGVMKTGLANIFLNFPCLIACLLCCLLISSFLCVLVLWLGICVEGDVDRIAILRHFKFGVVGMLLGTINLLPGVR